MSDDRISLTPDEAAGLLVDGDYVHSFRQAGFALLGADWERAYAIAALSKAKSIEIGGPACQAMKHPIVMIDAHGPCFLEADMAKTAEMEAAKTREPTP